MIERESPIDPRACTVEPDTHYIGLIISLSHPPPLALFLAWTYCPTQIERLIKRTSVGVPWNVPR